MMQITIQPANVARGRTLSAEDWQEATGRLRHALDRLFAHEVIKSDPHAQTIIRGMIGQDIATVDGQMDLLTCRVEELLAVRVSRATNRSPATAAQAARSHPNSVRTGNMPGGRTVLAL